MEGMLSATEKDSMVSSFLEIAVGQTADTARQFLQAKAAASVQDKWLLINLQSTKEFSSHMLNRDTWANEAVSQTISTNFIFWQVYDDTSEGQKVCTYYRLDSIPVVLVIDPITGQKMRLWCGMVQPESLLEDLVPYMDGGPRDHHKNLSNKRPRGGSLTSLKNKDEPKEEVQEVVGAVSAPSETMIDSSVAVPDNKSASETKKDKETSPSMKTQYPPLPEEPKGDRSILCKVGLRFPDGRRVQRNFLKTDPVQLLWSFCCSEVKEAETRPFRLTQAIPGAKTLDSGSSITFGESGLENSMILLAWE
ncbi:Plant UBX domain-containing protein 7 [Linum grandiflorum]